MQRQEMFDKAYNGVLDQGFPAWSGEQGMCTYYENGRMCALGLILGEDLARDWAFRGVVDVWDALHTDGLEVPDWVYEEVDFLAQIQEAHDTDAGYAVVEGEVDAWRESFKNKISIIAKMYRLTVPERN